MFIISYRLMTGVQVIFLAIFLFSLSTMEAKSTNPSTVIYPTVEVLDYNDLCAGVDLSTSIERAYGLGGPGLLTVKNVPGLTHARYL